MRRILLAATLSIVLLPGRAAPQAPGPVSDPAPAGKVRELRLGVICYGGISLAIYMYGTTRELHNLLLASDALELDAGAAPPVQPGAIGAHGEKLSASAQHYYQLLSEEWKKDGVRTRVVIDIISGTSAGGINGVILAKAIATNRPIDDLRRLWFEEADIVRLAGGRPWTLRAAWRLLHKRPALTGDRWLRQLYEAFATMDRRQSSSPSASLLPRGSRLDLLVTSTDYYGSPRVVEVGDPPTSHDKYHNQVFHFEFPGQSGESESFAGPAANATLAFAARSSASFPVAFPPTSIAELLKVLPDARLDGAALARQLFRHQLLDRGKCAPDEDCARALAQGLFLVDGGVLDNYPLGIAFQRTSRTTPSVPTQRVFLYLEPDPSAPPPEGSAGLSSGAPNSWQIIWGASATIPGNEPIAEDFRQLARHNERVDRILDLLASNERQARMERRDKARKPAGVTVAAMVEDIVEYDLDGEVPSGMRQKSSSPEAPLAQQAVASQRRQIEEDAAAAQPVVEEAYLRLRVHSVLDQAAHDLASDVCGLPEDYVGPRVSLARAIVFQWAEARRLKEAPGRDPEAPQLDREGRKEFLDAWDLGYLRRNLRFVLSWIDSQYPGGKPDHSYGLTADQVELAHAAVKRGIDELSALVRGDRLASLVGDEGTFVRLHDALCVKPDRYEQIRDQAAAVVAQHKETIDAFVNTLTPKLREEQDRIRGELFERFVTQTAAWKNPEARREILARYLGFPYWDRVAYPYIAFSGTGELAHADVKRLSPRDAIFLSGRDVGAERLSGSRLGHFGAFFHREGRENDYVWGRWDGAERLSALLGGSASDGLFSQILDEEKSAVGAKVYSHLRSCVDHPTSQACKEPAPSR